MIFLKLFMEFLKIGMFSFGGAYGAIPLISECVIRNGWLDEAMFANMLAISESTPGPIMVNAATYIGSAQAGIVGALTATVGVVLPSFVIILIVSIFLRKWMESCKVQSVLRGVKPCLMGVILATGVYMAFSLLTKSAPVDLKTLVILGVLGAITAAYQKVTGKEFSPILLILISAVLGVVLL